MPVGRVGRQASDAGEGGDSEGGRKHRRRLVEGKAKGRSSRSWFPWGGWSGGATGKVHPVGGGEEREAAGGDEVLDAISPRSRRSSFDYDPDDLAALEMADLGLGEPPPLERTNSMAMALDRQGLTHAAHAEQAQGGGLQGGAVPLTPQVGHRPSNCEAFPEDFGARAASSLGGASGEMGEMGELGGVLGSAAFGDVASVDGDASADGEGSVEGFFSEGSVDGFEGKGPSGASRPRRHFRKTLRPAAAQLEALGLKPGPNTIVFSVHSSLQGRQAVSSTVWLLDPNIRLVISDVDGTITKSDVLGQLMPRVGYDWSHLGVTSLYQQVTSHGYQMVYLTARGIGMAGTTREYLSAVQQGEHTLPAGPCFLSPSRLIECFTREVRRRMPHRVAAPNTWSYSPSHAVLQPLAHGVAAPGTHGCRSSGASPRSSRSHACSTCARSGRRSTAPSTRASATATRTTRPTPRRVCRRRAS